MSSIVAIAGSLRHRSLNRRLVAEAARIGPSVGLTITIFDGLAGIPLFDEDLEVDWPAGPGRVGELRALVRAADGVLFATPEYNQSMPGVMKNLVDWLSRPDDGAVLDGTPVALVGATTGPWGTRIAQKELRHTLTAAGAIVLPQPMLFLPRADAIFGDDGHLSDASAERRLADLLRAFERWIGLVAAVATPA